MLIKTSTKSANKVWSGTVEVEADALEQQYFTAYGEPQIDLAGDIPYVPNAPALPPGQITLDSESDIGTPPVSGEAVDEPGIDGLNIKGSGVFPTNTEDTVGFFKFTQEVVGDFEFKCRIDYVDGGLIDSGADPTTVEGFRVGLMLQYGDGSDDPAVLFGWGSHLSAFNLALWHRLATHGQFAEINSVSRDNYRGLFLKLTRESLSLKAEYSTDNGQTWNMLATTTLQRQAYRVGLFINSGTAELANALITNLSLTQSPVQNVNIFTIGGSPKLAYMRSQAPHTFALDGKVVEEAENKVKGWVAEIQSRLSAAKTTLFQNPSPLDSDKVTQI